MVESLSSVVCYGGRVVNVRFVMVFVRLMELFLKDFGNGVSMRVIEIVFFWGILGVVEDNVRGSGIMV